VKMFQSKPKPVESLPANKAAEEYAFNERMAARYEADPAKKRKAMILRANNAKIRENWKAGGQTDKQLDDLVKMSGKIDTTAKK